MGWSRNVNIMARDLSVGQTAVEDKVEELSDGEKWAPKAAQLANVVGGLTACPI